MPLVISKHTKITGSSVDRLSMFVLLFDVRAPIRSPFVFFAQDLHLQNKLENQTMQKEKKRKAMVSPPPAMTTTCIRGYRKANARLKQDVTTLPYSYAIITKVLVPATGFPSSSWLLQRIEQSKDNEHPLHPLRSFASPCRL